MPRFFLKKIDGKYFEHVFQIEFLNQETHKYIIWGQIKFGLNRKNDYTSIGERRVWISVHNRILYSQHDLKRIFDYINYFHLKYEHITSLDISLDLDLPAAKIKETIRNKNIITILNGKRIINRNEERPEIISVFH